MYLGTLETMLEMMSAFRFSWLAGQVQHGRYHHCPNGSHVAQCDYSEIYFEGLIGFIKDVDAKRF